MSKKFKVGQTVRVKESGKVGVVKSREITKCEDNHVKVEYIVKLGDGFNNWKSFSKKELESVGVKKEMPTYPKIFKKEYKVHGQDLMMVAVLQKMMNAKWLFIGHALRSENDAYNENFAFKLAKRRAILRPITKICSIVGSDLKEEMINAIMDSKKDYIENNFSNFSK